MPAHSLRSRGSLLWLAVCIGAVLVGLAAPVLCAGDAPSGAPGKIQITSKGVDPPARWAARHDPERARLAIATQDGNGELVLTRDVVAVQLSDRGLARVRQQLRATRDESREDNPLGWFEAAVLAAVGSFVNHSAECDLEDVDDARYVGGRIVLTDHHGHELFAHIDVDGRDLMASFSEDDARRFVRKFHHLKEQQS